VEKPYHDPQERHASIHFLTKNGQALLPMVELIEQSQLAVDQLIDVLGRASIEAVLRRRPQTRVGLSRRSQREPGGGTRVVRRPDPAGPRPTAEAVICDRRLEGAAGGHRCGFRGTEPRAADVLAIGYEPLTF
jgi:hypothetical protein